MREARGHRLGFRFPETETPYEISQKMRDEIDLIKSQVDEARAEYARHLRVLDALTKAATEEPLGNSEDREDVTPATSRQSGITELLDVSGKTRQAVEQSEREEAVEERGTASAPPPNGRNRPDSGPDRERPTA